MVSELHRLALTRTSLVLAGVFDADAARCAQRAREWETRAFSSLDELVADEDIDAVLVLTPEYAHLPVATAALEAGKHVLIEKPVAATSDGVRALAALAAERGLVAMPGHNYAYVPEFTRLARLAREQELGRLRSLHVVYAIAHPEEVAQACSGVLEHIMTHHSYLALALMGAPDRVHAGVSRPGWERLDREDQAWMVWEYGVGAVAHLSASFAVSDDSADPWTFVVKAMGTGGSASMTFRSAYLRRPLGTLDFGLPVYEESYEHELRAFGAAIDSGTDPLSTLWDAATCADIIGGAYIAAQTGTSFDLPEAIAS